MKIEFVPRKNGTLAEITLHDTDEPSLKKLFECTDISLIGSNGEAIVNFGCDYRQRNWKKKSVSP